MFPAKPCVLKESSRESRLEPEELPIRISLLGLSWAWLRCHMVLRFKTVPSGIRLMFEPIIVNRSMASLAEEIENVRLTELQDLEQASDTAAKRPHRLQIVCYQTGRFPTPEVKPYACVSACVCVCVWTSVAKRKCRLQHCRGTQHVTGTVSNEATSDMGSKG